MKYGLIDVTLVLDTSAYADNDVLSDTATVHDAVPYAGGRGILRSVRLLDEDDQGVEIDLVFFRTNVSLGTKNGAVSISDANAREILGHVSIVAADYTDLVNSQVATKSGLNLVLKAAGDSRDVFVSAIVRSGTPTYTASGIKLKIGIDQGD